MTVGSAIGYSAGFPLSLEGAAPSIFNITSQQFLLNPAQKWLVRSARSQWRSSILTESDQSRQAALAAATVYLDLSKTSLQMESLRKAHEAAVRLIYIQTEHLKADVGSNLSLS